MVQIRRTAPRLVPFFGRCEHGCDRCLELISVNLRWLALPVGRADAARLGRLA
jgi:hypothetical protein